MYMQAQRALKRLAAQSNRYSRLLATHEELLFGLREAKQNANVNSTLEGMDAGMPTQELIDSAIAESDKLKDRVDEDSSLAIAIEELADGK